MWCRSCRRLDFASLLLVCECLRQVFRSVHADFESHVVPEEVHRQQRLEQSVETPSASVRQDADAKHEAGVARRARIRVRVRSRGVSGSRGSRGATEDGLLTWSASER